MGPERCLSPDLGSWLRSGLLFCALGLWVVVLVGSFRRLRGRPPLVALAFAGTLPAVYVGLAWAGLVSEQFLRLERPLLAFPGAVIILGIGHRLRALPVQQHRLRRILIESTAGGAAMTAMLASLGCEGGLPLDRLAVVVVLDRSRSIELVPDAESRIAAERRVAELGMREDDRIGLVAFASEATVEEPLRPRSSLPAPQEAALGRDATDIGGAIRRALAELPPDSAGRIVLVSDGVSTRGDPMGAALAALAADVPVDFVPLDQARIPNVRVVDLRAPERVSESEPLDLRLATESTAAAELEVRLRRDGQLLSKGRARVRAGEDLLMLREIAPEPGLHRYEVEVTAIDSSLDLAATDNSGSAFLRVEGEAAALILDGNPELGAPLARALENAAFRVQLVGPAQVPADVGGYAAYDLVVVSDIQAADLAPTQLEALATYVRHLGGGLLLMGGDRAFGPGGYGATPVEDLSPLSFDLKQDRRRASLAEVIVIDYSGSMAQRASGGRTKLELANEAAIRSAALLGHGDRVGVMHVDTTVRWTVPLAPMTGEPALAEAVRQVGPGGGGILVDLALRAAYARIAPEHTNLKHVLLFSDGSDAEEKQSAPVLVGEAKDRGITTSVVALGRGSDVPALERLSQIGAGRFYLIEDAARLPAVFAQETVLATRSALNEVTFRPRLGVPGPPTRGVPLNDMPPLTGYVVTVPKGRSQVWLTGPEGDPILASWSVGIGRAAAFTSDYRDRWGQEWTSWKGASKLFGQLGRMIARQGNDPRVRLEASARMGALHLRATVIDDDGRAETFRRLSARVGGPAGFAQTVALEPSGAGSYSATVPLSRSGVYVVTATDEGRDEAVATAGVSLDPGEELRPTGTDRALLRQLAEVTGGRERDTLAGVFHDRAGRRFAHRSLTSPLLLASALLLWLSVAARRIQVPPGVERLGARLRSRWRARQDPSNESRDKPEAPPPAAPGHPRSSAPESPQSGPSDPPPAAPPRGETPPTAAEILLLRRKKR